MHAQAGGQSDPLADRAGFRANHREPLAVLAGLAARRQDGGAERVGHHRHAVLDQARRKLSHARRVALHRVEKLDTRGLHVGSGQHALSQVVDRRHRRLGLDERARDVGDIGRRALVVLDEHRGGADCQPGCAARPVLPDLVEPGRAVFRYRHRSPGLH